MGSRRGVLFVTAGSCMLAYNSFSPHSSLRKARPQRYNNRLKITYGETRTKRGRHLLKATELTGVRGGIQTQAVWLERPRCLGSFLLSWVLNTTPKVPDSHVEQQNTLQKEEWLGAGCRETHGTEASLGRSGPTAAFVCGQRCRPNDSQPNRRQALLILQWGKEKRPPELVKGPLYQQVETSFDQDTSQHPVPWILEDSDCLLISQLPSVPETSLELCPPSIAFTFPTILRVPTARDSNEAEVRARASLWLWGRGMPRPKGTNSPDKGGDVGPWQPPANIYVCLFNNPNGLTWLIFWTKQKNPHTRKWDVSKKNKKGTRKVWIRTFPKSPCYLIPTRIFHHHPLP